MACRALAANMMIRYEPEMEKILKRLQGSPELVGMKEIM
jgi:hypothetical protein